MKTLQNNFTTPEQSKRLLELGLPAWTADCYYYEEGGISKDCTPNIVPFGEVWTDESEETWFSSYVDVPCWSVGRLIEILSKCMPSEIYTPKFHIDDNIVDVVLDAIELELDYGLDFSKLEE